MFSNSAMVLFALIVSTLSSQAKDVPKEHIGVHSVDKRDEGRHAKPNDSSPVVVNRVGFCPDGSFCPDRSTCCQQPNGIYGCCPHVSGVCCFDRLYCCPNGYRCNTVSQTCNNASQAIQGMSKVPAKRAGGTVLFEDGSD